MGIVVGHRYHFGDEIGDFGLKQALLGRRSANLISCISRLNRDRTRLKARSNQSCPLSLLPSALCLSCSANLSFCAIFVKLASF